MKYTIGDVSEALNLSREMIRYYEKNGVLKLSRDSSNNYRTYETMDIFWLLESLQYRSWGVGIKEIQNVRGEDFHLKTADLFSQYAEELEKEILTKTLLKERLEKISVKMRSSFYNLSNIHVEYIPSYYSFHLVNGYGDEYERIDVRKEIRDVFFTSENIGFLDSGILIGDDCQEWIMTIDEKYLNALHIPAAEGMTYEEGGFFLCMNSDIGEIGKMDLSEGKKIQTYADEKGFRTDGRLRGVLIGRGEVNGTFRRIMEMRMKIIA